MVIGNAGGGTFLFPRFAWPGVVLGLLIIKVYQKMAFSGFARNFAVHRRSRITIASVVCMIYTHCLSASGIVLQGWINHIFLGAGQLLLRLCDHVFRSVVRRLGLELLRRSHVSSFGRKIMRLNRLSRWSVHAGSRCTRYWSWMAAGR